ncbi:MAG: DUF401 family protein [Candidatus Latescibacteria bacterium]|nr:DUF401 family protein [Candidatus Latescibacterota bacterium]
MGITWAGFLLSLFLLLIISRKSLWAGLVVAALTLGLFTLPFYRIWQEVYNTLTDPSILLLSFGVGLIPMIGGLMELSGLMDELVDNLRIGKRLFSAFSPALLGMLPIPGGALLSAPLLRKAGEGISEVEKSAINVWFRHILLLIYPLGALLATTKMAQLNLYVTMLYLIPGFILMFILGYLFLLKHIRGEISYSSDFRLKGLLVPVMIILIAPVIHFSLGTIFPKVLPEVFLVIGVVVSLTLALGFGNLRVERIKLAWTKTGPWRFSLIIIGMFLFLNIFKASDASRIIAEVTFSRTLLLVGVGSILGFLTGRVQVPVSILLPIYYSKYGTNTMTSSVFALMFFSIFMGYVISPVHPCVSVSLEFFNVELKDFLKVLIIPILISLSIAFMLGAIFL